MRIVVFNSIKSAKRLIKENPGLDSSMFQSYPVLRAVEKCTRRREFLSFMKHPMRTVVRRMRGRMRFLVLAVYDENGALILIAPLFIDENGDCQVVGRSQYLDYQDFLYVSGNMGQLKHAMRCVCDWLREREVVSIRFGALDENSRTNSLIAKMPLLDVTEAHSVNVFFGMGYIGYWNNLGKHAKQNLRTAYNRLDRDGHAVELKFFSCYEIGETLESKDFETVFRDCLRIYCDRQLSRYKKRGGKMFELEMRHMNRTVLSVRSPVGFLSALYVDQSIAGFMCGYVNIGKKRLEVPRLAINEVYRWYSPGLVLINETVKLLSSSTDEIVAIDLCRGEEKYKYDMGGKSYLTRDFKLVVNQ